MARSIRGTSKKFAAAALAATFGFSGLAVATAPTAFAQVAENRYGGEDRYDTARLIAEDAFGPAVANAVVARGDGELSFADALAVSALAGQLNGPILLTNSAELSQPTEEALTGLDVQNVTIAGGTAAVTSDVEDEIEALGINVDRVFGADRYATAAAIANALDAIGQVNGQTTAFLARGDDFADALTAGPAAYDDSLPIILTLPNDLPAVSADALEDLGIQHVVIVGGTAAINQGVEDEVEAMGITTERLFGANRFGTAAEVAMWLRTELGFAGEGIAFANGFKFPDALSGASIAALRQVPILLTSSLSTETEAAIREQAEFLLDQNPGLSAEDIFVLIFGGTAVIDNETVDQIVDIIEDVVGESTGFAATVTPSTLGPGDTFDISVTGEGLESATLDGCGFNNEVINDTDPNEAGRQDDFTIPNNQPPGSCTLTITVIDDNGDEHTVTRQITVTEPVNNADFSVSPTDTIVLGDSEDGAVAGSVTFSGLEPGVEYDFYMFPCGTPEGSHVFSNGDSFVGPDGHSNLDGIISFRDDDEGSGSQPQDIIESLWNNSGETNNNEIDIVLVGGEQPNDQDEYDLVAPANGTLQATFGASQGSTDCGIPALFEDGADEFDDAVPLNDEDEDTLENDDTPAVPFAVGPAVVVFDGVGENGDEPSGDVEFVGAPSLFEDNLLGDGDDVGVVIDWSPDLFGIDFDTDNFFYDGAEFDGPITREQARGYLSIADQIGTCDFDDACNNIDTPYTETGTNNWLFEEDTLPVPATGVQANVGDFDGDAEGLDNDVRLSWMAPSFGTVGLGGDVDEYCWEIFDAEDPDNGSVDNGCTDEVNSQQTGDAPTETECDADDCDVEDLAPGTYRARVDFIDSETDGQNDGPTSAWSPEFTVSAIGAPLSLETETGDTPDTVGDPNLGTLEGLDTLVVDFDQAMNTNGADDEAILEDPDGTRCRLDDLNSAFVYSDDPDPDGDDDFTNERLTITLDAGTCEAGGAAGITQAGTVGGMQFPVEVIETDGIVDADDGFDWNLEDSPDTTFE